MSNPVGRPPESPEVRWQRQYVVGAPDECWPWAGPRDSHNYGRFWTGSGGILAHRESWIRSNGAIPEGMFVCHHCDNPPCCNPSHLFLGRSLENNADRSRKGRTAWGERSPHARLTDAQATLIRATYSGRFGEKSALARQYGVSRTAIRNVLTGVTYAHVA